MSKQLTFLWEQNATILSTLKTKTDKFGHYFSTLSG